VRYFHKPGQQVAGGPAVTTEMIPPIAATSVLNTSPKATKGGGKMCQERMALSSLSAL